MHQCDQQNVTFRADSEWYILGQKMKLADFREALRSILICCLKLQYLFEQLTFNDLCYVCLLLPHGRKFVNVFNIYVNQLPNHHKQHKYVRTLTADIRQQRTVKK